MKNILEKNRITLNILRGASSGLFAWILTSIFERMFGVSLFWYDLSYFIAGGSVVGAVIGMISNEVFWHKYKHDK